ncbi:MAG TPA: hypothetical protein VE244_15505 [Nitrososphaeraceae archaeon]|nr:hypothetical protein [Nitrososphaeraceae archaeon]
MLNEASSLLFKIPSKNNAGILTYYVSELNLIEVKCGGCGFRGMQHGATNST